MNKIYVGEKNVGTYVIKSNQHIIIPKAGSIFSGYNIKDFLIDEYFYLDNNNNEVCRSSFYAQDATNIEISAEKNGIIHGQGMMWLASRDNASRPGLIKLVNCVNVRIHDLILIDSAMWSILLYNCENVIVDNVTIVSKLGVGNVGIIVDGCRNVSIKNSNINTGDDCLVIKTVTNIPCEEVIVENCILKTMYSALKVGTETVGDISNIDFKNCTVEKSLAYAIKIFATDGGSVSNVNVENILVKSTNGTFVIANGERMGEYIKDKKGQKYSSVSNITLKKIKAYATDEVEDNSTKKVGEGTNIIFGTKKNKVNNLKIDNCEFQMLGGLWADKTEFEVNELGEQYPEYYVFGIVPASGLYLNHVVNARIKETKFSFRERDNRKIYYFENTKNIDIEDS